ncbi:MAG: amidohydrolase family protein [Gemmatimonadales bacterium]
MDRWLRVLSVLVAGPLAAGAAQAPRDPPTAFVGVAVIDMVDEQVQRDRTVVVWDDRIVAVGPRSEVPIPPDARRIEGRGRFLIPGLTDAHVHFRADTAVNAALLRLHLSYGVTSVLNLSGRPEVLAAKRAVADGALLGPTIYSSGPIHDDSTLTFADGERLVEEEAAAGYDFVKVYNRLSRPAYWGMISAARRVGIPVVGHVVRSLDGDGFAGCDEARIVCRCEHCFETTLTSGQRAIVHMEEVQYGFFRSHAFRHPVPLARMRPAIPGLARRVAESGIWVIPTLEVYRNIPRQLDSLDAVLARPEMRYMPRAMTDRWRRDSNPYLESMTPDVVPGFRESYALLAELTLAFQRAGVRLLAGTDVGVPSVIAGLGLHWELQHLVEAGLTPWEALATATRLPGEFLGRGAFGTIRSGQRADLILLDANPLDAIANTLRQAGVMARGRWLDGPTVAGMLRELAEAGADD